MGSMISTRPNVYRRLGLAALAVLLLAFTIYSARFALDFEIYYGAAEKILAGNPDVYPQDRTPPADLAPFHVYRLPPVAAVLLAPIALLPLEVSAFLFGLAKLAALFSIVTMVLRLMGKDMHYRGKILVLSLLGVGGYFVEEFRNGNFHLLSLWIVVAAVYLAERSKNVLPAFLLAVVASVRFTPVIYVPYFGMRRRWLLCAATMGFIILLFLLPSAIFGVEAGGEMLDAFVELTVQKTVDPHNYSLRGAILKYLTSLDVEEPKYGKINFVSLPETTANALWWCSVAVIGLVLLVSTRGPIRDLVTRRRKDEPCGIDGPTRTLLEVSLWTTALLLASPHTQRFWFSSLFLPFAVMLGMIVEKPDDRRRRWIHAAVGVSFLVGTLLPPLLPGRAVALAYEVRSPYLFATIFVFAVLTWLLWTNNSADGDRK